MDTSSYSTEVLDVSVNMKFVRIVHIVYAAKMFTFVNSTPFYDCHIIYLF